MLQTAGKAALGTLIVGVILITLHHLIGYEKTELLAFALLIGLTIGSMKGHG